MVWTRTSSNGAGGRSTANSSSSVIRTCVILLDETPWMFECQPKDLGCVIFDALFEHLQLQERRFFGLRYLDNANNENFDDDDATGNNTGGQVHWLEPQTQVGKQLLRNKCATVSMSPPFAKNSSSTVDSANIYTLYFCVKFYSPAPDELDDENSRYQFFLQIKQDISHGRLHVPRTTLAELCAYAIQSDIGDYDPNELKPGYTSEYNFAPEQDEALFEQIEVLHKKLMRTTPAEAERAYLSKVKHLELYGVDLHPITNKAEHGVDYDRYFLGLSPAGIMIIRTEDKMQLFPWMLIEKVTRPRAKYVMLHILKQLGTTQAGKKPRETSSLGFCFPTPPACLHFFKSACDYKQFFAAASSFSYNLPKNNAKRRSKLFALANGHQEQDAETSVSICAPSIAAGTSNGGETPTPTEFYAATTTVRRRSSTIRNRMLRMLSRINLAGWCSSTGNDRHQNGNKVQLRKQNNDSLYNNSQNDENGGGHILSAALAGVRHSAPSLTIDEEPDENCEDEVYNNNRHADFLSDAAHQNGTLKRNPPKLFPPLPGNTESREHHQKSNVSSNDNNPVAYRRHRHGAVDETAAAATSSEVSTNISQVHQKRLPKLIDLNTSSAQQLSKLPSVTKPRNEYQYIDDNNNIITVQQPATPAIPPPLPPLMTHTSSVLGATTSIASSRKIASLRPSLVGAPMQHLISPEFSKITSSVRTTDNNSTLTRSSKSHKHPTQSVSSSSVIILDEPAANNDIKIGKEAFKRDDTRRGSFIVPSSSGAYVNGGGAGSVHRQQRQTLLAPSSHVNPTTTSSHPNRPFSGEGSSSSLKYVECLADEDDDVSSFPNNNNPMSTIERRKRKRTKSPPKTTITLAAESNFESKRSDKFLHDLEQQRCRIPVNNSTQTLDRRRRTAVVETKHTEAATVALKAEAETRRQKQGQLVSVIKQHGTIPVENGPDNYHRRYSSMSRHPGRTRHAVPLQQQIGTNAAPPPTTAKLDAIYSTSKKISSHSNNIYGDNGRIFTYEGNAAENNNNIGLLPIINSNCRVTDFPATPATPHTPKQPVPITAAVRNPPTNAVIPSAASARRRRVVARSHQRRQTWSGPALQKHLIAARQEQQQKQQQVLLGAQPQSRNVEEKIESPLINLESDNEDTNQYGVTTKPAPAVSRPSDDLLALDPGIVNTPFTPPAVGNHREVLKKTPYVEFVAERDIHALPVQMAHSKQAVRHLNGNHWLPATGPPLSATFLGSSSAVGRHSLRQHHNSNSLSAHNSNTELQFTGGQSRAQLPAHRQLPSLPNGVQSVHARHSSNVVVSSDARATSKAKVYRLPAAHDRQLQQFFATNEQYGVNNGIHGHQQVDAPPPTPQTAPPMPFGRYNTNARGQHQTFPAASQQHQPSSEVFQFPPSDSNSTYNYYNQQPQHFGTFRPQQQKPQSASQRPFLPLQAAVQSVAPPKLPEHSHFQQVLNGNVNNQQAYGKQQHHSRTNSLSSVKLRHQVATSDNHQVGVDGSKSSAIIPSEPKYATLVKRPPNANANATTDFLTNGGITFKADPVTVVNPPTVRTSSRISMKNASLPLNVQLFDQKVAAGTRILQRSNDNLVSKAGLRVEQQPYRAQQRSFSQMGHASSLHSLAAPKLISSHSNALASRTDVSHIPVGYATLRSLRNTTPQPKPANQACVLGDIPASRRPLYETFFMEDTVGSNRLCTEL